MEKNERLINNHFVTFSHQNYLFDFFISIYFFFVLISFWIHFRLQLHVITTFLGNWKKCFFRTLPNFILIFCMISESTRFSFLYIKFHFFPSHFLCSFFDLKILFKRDMKANTYSVYFFKFLIVLPFCCQWSNQILQKCKKFSVVLRNLQLANFKTKMLV